MKVAFLKILALSGLFLSLNHALIGDWHSYTYLDNIVDMAEYSGKAYVGTTGGIRVLNPKGGETVLNNPQKGLLDVEISGFALAAKKLWAVSKKGIVYEFSGNIGDEVQNYNRNFSEYAGTVNPQALATAGPFLILGSTKGISLFLIEDLDGFKKGTFYETLYDFGPVKSPSVTAILVDGFGITLATDMGVFQANIYWENPKNPPDNFLSENGRLLNPQIWSPIDVDSSETVKNGLIIGSLSKSENSIIARGPGKTLNTDPNTYIEQAEPFLYKGHSYHSHLSGSSVLEIEGRLFLGDTSGLFELRQNKFSKIANANSLPKGQIINVSALNGNVSLWNLDYYSPILGWTSLVKLENNRWKPQPQFPLPHIIEPIAKRLNVFFSEDENTHYFGNWGWGIQKLKNGLPVYLNSQNSCLEGISSNPDYVIIRAMSPNGDKGVFFAQYTVSAPFNMGYLDFDNFSVTCYPKNILSNELSNFSHDIKVVEENYLLVSTEKNLELFEISNPRSSNGLTAIKDVYIDASGSQEIRAANMDNYGRVWAVGNSGIYFGENFITSDEDSLLLVEGVEALECNYMKKDPAGNIWAACKNGLLQIKPSLENTDTQIKFYRNSDGLLKEDVFHIDIDPANGNIWVVTERGLSKFEADGPPPLPDNDHSQVFPNPFLARHQYVVFSNLNNDSRIMIFNQGGDKIFETRNNEILGGQFKWNGQNRGGKKARAGVYYYSIVNSGDIKKGKLIIAR